VKDCRAGLTTPARGAKVGALPSSLPEPHRTRLVTAVAAAAGGAALSLLHVPLAWMIGSLVATAALGWWRPVDVPGWARPAGLVFLGLGLGATFSGPVLAAVTGALPALLVAGVVSIVAGVAVAPVFRRVAGADARTSVFAAVPGGIVVMAMLAQEAKVPVAPVTLAQTIRVLVVVLTFPPLLGWLAPHGAYGEFMAPRQPFSLPGLAAMAAGGLLLVWPLRRLGIANPWMLGPCGLAIALAATGWLPSGVPKPLVDAAQVAMGATLGLRLNRALSWPRGGCSAPPCWPRSRCRRCWRRWPCRSPWWRTCRSRRRSWGWRRAACRRWRSRPRRWSWRCRWCWASI
jgi:uncharacterized protein